MNSIISRPFPAVSRVLRGLRVKAIVDVLGSLKDPCKAGSPDKTIGINGEILTPRTS
jgi:hypothetical protein